MGTFSDKGRDLSGWTMLREIHASLYAKPEMTGLEMTIGYDRDMPTTSVGGSIDIVAGTGVTWNLPDDTLDHHWEVRRIERIAPAWRALLPCDIDHEGWSIADCWITMDARGIRAHAHRDNGDETDSTLTIILEAWYGGWKDDVEFSCVWERPLSDILAMGNQELCQLVVDHEWTAAPEHIGPAYRRGDDLIVHLDTAVLLKI